ncbi:S41 family peptidase [Hymenobacter sp. CRA2]|uniref:S41 family peptidase n=1 Tax=Hymenobacter sp. CRA2 TaxID=1955620 RepID=UPI00098EAE40|nr:S41 family peptidase [Hymenobacter sp. CRA2]OON71107.1 hypothetical protein B0919_03715 [Hymenobacter sp. CRA2]
MKQTIVLAALLGGAHLVTGQNNPYQIADSVKQHLDQSLALLRQHALQRDQVDWAQLQAAVYEKARGAQSVQATLPVYPYLFEQLRDSHGWFSYKGRSYGWSPARAPYTNAAVKAALKQKPGVRVRVLDGRYGYVRVPSMQIRSLEDVQRQAQALRDSLCRVQPRRLRGWIIDLRLNDGGAMHPMLAGLAPLIGDGLLGGFVDPSGKPTEQWRLRGGDLYVDTMRFSRLGPATCPMPRKPQPVAVLLSGRTASAGEVVAISLKGRPGTRFFGEPSYGATTANEGFELSAQSGLSIATQREIDRTGTLYQEQVLPDEPIDGGDNFIDLNQDAKVRAALQWLRKAKVRPSRPKA